MLADKNRLAIIVLGMHRSGTSMLTGLLDQININLGDDLMESTKYNFKGYFENKIY